MAGRYKHSPACTSTVNGVAGSSSSWGWEGEEEEEGVELEGRRSEGVTGDHVPGVQGTGAQGGRKSSHAAFFKTNFIHCCVRPLHLLTPRMLKNTFIHYHAEV